MKKYIVITNIWGKKRSIYFGTLMDVFKEEKEEFDTMEEVNEYVSLFEGVCSQYEMPEKKQNEYRGREIVKDKLGRSYHYEFTNDEQRLWGYVIADTENLSIVRWGGFEMLNINKRMNKLELKDRLFRGPDEIPKNYKWDNGEYEGWLQFRWGDGKNAIGYVEPKKEIKEKDDKVIELDDYSFTDEIEQEFLDKEEKERLKILQERW